MNVYLDNIIFYLQNYGGISVYWSRLISTLLKCEDINVNFIAPAGFNPKFKGNELLPKHLIKNDRNLPLWLLRYAAVNSNVISDNSIFHSSYYRHSSNRKVKNITTVYDFTYEYYGGGSPRMIHHWQKSQAIKNSSGIICISENTKRDLMKFYPNLEEERIKVIYLSADDSFYKINNIRIVDTQFRSLEGRRIISFVGKRLPYKRFKTAVDVIKMLPADYHLLVVGGGGLNKREIQDLYPVRERCSWVENVDAAELNLIYNISFCYIYPSEYEGFGIPILEAMRAGCPVICQNVSSIPEVYGGVDNIIKDINNIEEFCISIRRLEDPAFRNNIINQGMQNSLRFSWDKTCDETLKFYQLISV